MPSSIGMLPASRRAGRWSGPLRSGAGSGARRHDENASPRKRAHRMAFLPSWAHGLVFLLFVNGTSQPLPIDERLCRGRRAVPISAALSLSAQQPHACRRATPVLSGKAPCLRKAGEDPAGGRCRHRRRLTTPAFIRRLRR